MADLSPAAVALHCPFVQSLLQTFDGAQIDGVHGAGLVTDASLASADVLYVSVELLVLVPDDVLLTHGAEDLTSSEPPDWRPRAYRRLSPLWYAYLHRMMARGLAKRASGELADDIWQVYRARFAAVWHWARQAWGDAALRDAEQTHMPFSYEPPRLHQGGRP